ncbi:MAG: trigger factor, partial [Bdellovibrionales bacterium]|nr:trigger factor [Bdellovibrionales bacterium]
MALTEHTLAPIGYPQVDFQSLEEDSDFEFTAEFEVRPDVKLQQYKGLKIQKEKFEITDDQINTVLDNIRNSRKESSPIFEDRPAQNGDVAVIDFFGTIDGAPLPGGQGEDHKLELGSNSFIPGFEEGVVGMKVGVAQDLKLKFPDDYHANEIAGKEVVFKVTLKALEKSVIPEANDELADKVGGFSTLEELKDAIKQDLTLGEEGRIKEDTRNRILKALVESNPVEVPKSMLAEQKKMLIDDVKMKMQNQGMTPDQFSEYVNKWDADFNDSASFMIQSSFLVDAIATENKLRANEEDVQLKITQYAAETGMEVDKINDFYKDPNKRANLKYQLTEEKVIEFLINEADITEVPKDKLKDA